MDLILWHRNYFKNLTYFNYIEKISLMPSLLRFTVIVIDQQICRNILILKRPLQKMLKIFFYVVAFHSDFTQLKLFPCHFLFDNSNN